MTELSTDALECELNGISDPFLTYVLNTKLSTNLDILRKGLVKEQLDSDPLQPNGNKIISYQEYYSNLAFKSSRRKHEALQLMTKEYNEYQENTKKRRYSVNFDASSAENVPIKEVQEIQNSDLSEETTELRRRLLGRGTSEDKGPNGSLKSVDRQIEDQDNLQSSLLESMTSLVGSLKQSASAFQHALEEDKNVVNAAEIGVQVASKSLTDISGKLKKYDKKKLGYLFYITVFLFMITGLVITFIIIKLFPAL